VSSRGNTLAVGEAATNERRAATAKSEENCILTTGGRDA
jgi:hypothetical protein